jgi:hypothetical protein
MGFAGGFAPEPAFSHFHRALGRERAAFGDYAPLFDRLHLFA